MNPLLDKFELDSYELGARYIPAFIFEILFLFSFHEYFKLNLEILKNLNEIFPLSIYLPIIILIFSFPVKAILRLIGEIIENFIWFIRHPTITYIKWRIKNLEEIEILIKECKGKNNLKELIEDKNCHQALIEYLKAKTRNDKKLKAKLIEHGFFRNTFAGLLLLTILDFFYVHKYYHFYLLLCLIFLVATLIYSYWSYPKQLMNSFREEYIKDNEQH